jgi:hypothetical protein
LSTSIPNKLTDFEYVLKETSSHEGAYMRVWRRQLQRVATAFARDLTPRRAAVVAAMFGLDDHNSGGGGVGVAVADVALCVFMRTALLPPLPLHLPSSLPSPKKTTPTTTTTSAAAAAAATVNEHVAAARRLSQSHSLTTAAAAAAATSSLPATSMSPVAPLLSPTPLPAALIVEDDGDDESDNDFDDDDDDFTDDSYDSDASIGSEESV